MRPKPSGIGETFHELSLRAFDLSERAGRAGLDSNRRRVQRWREHLFMMSQIAIAAGLAWFLGQHLLGHQLPFFAAVAAIICLGLSFGQRISRVVQVAVGVFVGVFVGDLFVALVGTGAWQISLVVFVAMSIAIWVGAKILMVNQAGIQAATVVTLFPNPDEGVSRWLDALLGCAIALVFALVAPTSPVQKPRMKAAQVLYEAAETLYAATAALRSGDENAADEVLARARSTEGKLRALSEASSEGIALVRYSPLMRQHRDHVQAVAEIVAPLDRMLRNLRVLARRVSVAAWRQDPVPAPVVALVDQTAAVMEFCASELYARRMPERARPRIVAVADATSQIDVSDLTLSTAVIIAQTRSILVDLLELTGLSYADAREQVPDMH
ncbi:MAG: FUSC family protein [Actinobacteria bacterium]|nr:FUSC family protein [Actinomycetota bacterium]